MNYLKSTFIFFICFIFLTGCSTVGRLGNALNLGTLGISQQELEKDSLLYSDDSSYLKVGDDYIHYKDTKNKGAITLVCIHGVKSSHYTWNKLVKLSKDSDIRFILPDLQGFGLTGPSRSKKYNVKEWVKAIDKLIEHLKLKGVYVVGNSLGGYVAANYAFDNQDKMKGLVLIDPIGFNQDVPFVLRFLVSRPATFLMGYTIPKFIVKSVLGRVYYDKSKISKETVSVYYKLALMEGNSAAYTTVLSDMVKNSHNKELQEKVVEGLSRLEIPVLIIWGDNDKWVPVSLSEQWKNNLSNVELIILDKCGHVPQEESPENVLDAIVSFTKN